MFRADHEMSRAADLKKLGLSEENSDIVSITKAFTKAAIRLHPDSGKGGSKSKFVEVVVAFERLTRPGGYYRLYDSNFDDDDNPQLGWHYRFFGARIHFGDGDLVASDKFNREYKPWSEQSTQERKKTREGNIRNMIDWRDTTGGGQDQRCMTCLKRDGITEECAKKSGLCWAEYKSHPDGLITCWACRNAHKSVMPAGLAMEKYPVLDPKRSSEVKSNPFVKGSNSALDGLCSFTHKPIRSGRPIQKMVLYWRKDIEAEAAKRGWRGKGIQGGKRPIERGHYPQQGGWGEAITPKKAKVKVEPGFDVLPAAAGLWGASGQASMYLAPSQVVHAFPVQASGAGAPGHHVSSQVVHEEVVKHEEVVHVSTQVVCEEVANQEVMHASSQAAHRAPVAHVVARLLSDDTESD